MRRLERFHAIGASRGAYLVCGLALALTLLAADAFANSHTGRGDFDFYLDSAAFRDRDGKVLTEVSLRIPSRALKFMPDKSGWKATVNMQLLIVDDAGKDVLRKAEKVSFVEQYEPNADNPITFETIIKVGEQPPAKDKPTSHRAATGSPAVSKTPTR